MASSLAALRRERVGDEIERVGLLAGSAVVFELVGRLVVDEVHAVGVAASAESDVAHLSVHVVAREQQPVITRPPLGLVDGDGVAVAHVPGGEVLAVESAVAVVGRDRDAAVPVVDVGDRADGAVADSGSGSRCGCRSPGRRPGTADHEPRAAVPGLRRHAATRRRARRLRSSTSALRLAIINADPPALRCAHQSATMASRTVSAFGAVTTRPCWRNAPTAWSTSPLRSWCSAQRSVSSCCRRFSVRVSTGCLFARAASTPPAWISGSCFGSPTSTTFARCVAASRRSGARVRVPTMPASSTTSTVRSSSRWSPRWRSRLSLAIVVERIPEPAWSSCAAEAESAQPITR